MTGAAVPGTTAWVAGAVCLVLSVLLRRHLGRSLMVPTLLVLAAASLAYAAFRTANTHPRVLGIALVVLAGLIAITVVVLAGFLIANGLLTRHRESHSLTNSLSLLLGVVLLAGPAAVVGVVRLHNPVAYVVGGAMGLALGYAGIVFAVFLVYALVQGSRTRPDRPAGTIVVLGSKIVRGEVPPLLQSRLDRALELYREAQRTGGPAPLLITSGGQGPDESRSESAAMTDYLVRHGAAAADVRGEDRSTSTRENLLLSQEVQRAAGRDGPLVVVTNGYHVLRATLHARRLGLDADVVGAPTAAYYVPSAVIREFVATFTDQWRLHVTLLALPMLGVGALLVLAVAST